MAVAVAVAVEVEVEVVVAVVVVVVGSPQAILGWLLRAGGLAQRPPWAYKPRAAHYDRNSKGLSAQARTAPSPK